MFSFSARNTSVQKFQGIANVQSSNGIHGEILESPASQHEEATVTPSEAVNSDTNLPEIVQSHEIASVTTSGKYGKKGSRVKAHAYNNRFSMSNNANMGKGKKTSNAATLDERRRQDYVAHQDGSSLDRDDTLVN